MFIYWGESATGYIGRANIDGTGGDSEWLNVGGNPRGVAVDDTYLYWTDRTNKRIGRVKLDGAGAEPEWIMTGTGETLDAMIVTATRVYWCEFTSVIGRANIDGSEPDTAWLNDISTIGNPLSLDKDDTYLYWADSIGSGEKHISRVKLDGSEPEGGTSRWLNEPADSIQAVAVNDTHMYWVNFTSGNIGRANIDGSEPDNEWLKSVAVGGRSIRVDSEYIYWVTNAGFIGRVKLDGTGAEGEWISAPSGNVFDFALGVGEEGGGEEKTVKAKIGGELKDAKRWVKTPSGLVNA